MRDCPELDVIESFINPHRQEECKRFLGLLDFNPCIFRVKLCLCAVINIKRKPDLFATDVL
ncbi:hypothetical protein D3C77_350250 [compost metagenome]